jgi:hypothetical protein
MRAEGPGSGIRMLSSSICEQLHAALVNFELIVGFLYESVTFDA